MPHPLFVMQTFGLAASRASRVQRFLKEQVYVMPDQAFAVVKPVRGFQVSLGHIPPAMLDEGVKRVGRILAGMGML
ncbi:hypothetical protein ACFQ4J_04930 [Laceyella tengchongensis]